MLGDAKPNVSGPTPSGRPLPAPGTSAVSVLPLASVTGLVIVPLPLSVAAFCTVSMLPPSLPMTSSVPLLTVVDTLPDVLVPLKVSVPVPVFASTTEPTEPCSVPAKLLLALPTPTVRVPAERELSSTVPVPVNAPGQGCGR